MRILLLPGNNALSHLGKALAVRETLLARGHEPILAVSQRTGGILAGMAIPHHRLRDVQEADLGPAPSFAWFRRPAHLQAVLAEEAALIRALRPDRVLGVFRFSAAAAAAIAGVPCDTLACGCMLPTFQQPLGFRGDEPEAAEQATFLNTFHRGCADRASRALAAFGLPPVADIRELLLGERTFLWDTPEFQPLPPAPGVCHVGPLAYAGWPCDPEAWTALGRLGRPLAVLSLGTTLPPESAPDRIIRALLRLGYQVAVVGGGFIPQDRRDPRIMTFRFAPMGALMDRADLLVCHGGQQTLFEAMARALPAVVLPFHPEQAQNGLCVERLGAGLRLAPPVPFWGSNQVYLDALERMDDPALEARLVAASACRAGLPGLARHAGAPAVAERLEQPCVSC